MSIFSLDLAESVQSERIQRFDSAHSWGRGGVGNIRRCSLSEWGSDLESIISSIGSSSLSPTSSSCLGELCSNRSFILSDDAPSVPVGREPIPAKPAPRTGRGGAGIVKIEDISAFTNPNTHPQTASLIAEHKQRIAQQERVIIEHSLEVSKFIHSTGRGGSGNISAPPMTPSFPSLRELSDSLSKKKKAWARDRSAPGTPSPFLSTPDLRSTVQVQVKSSPLAPPPRPPRKERPKKRNAGMRKLWEKLKKQERRRPLKKTVRGSESAIEHIASSAVSLNSSEATDL